jgi:hypothetical protein
MLEIAIVLIVGFALGYGDYDVLADGTVVGRIMKALAAPVGAPWFWTLGVWMS